MRLYDLPQDALTAGPCAGSTGANGALPALSACGDNWEAALRMPVGETVYDYCWYPRMSAQEPVSCCFAVSARVRVVHDRSIQPPPVLALPTCMMPRPSPLAHMRLWVALGWLQRA